MKYKIVIGRSDETPFVVKRKNESSFFSFWRTVAKFRAQYEAENFVKRAVERRSKYQVGQVVMEYDEADLIADRLKNKVRNMSGETEIAADTAG